MTNAEVTRRRLLRDLAAAGGLAAVGGLAAACGSDSSTARSTTASTARAGGSPTGSSTTSTTGRPAALLGPGDRPYPGRPEGIDTMPEVEHIVIYMQENHSYDNYFGMLGRGDGFTRDAKGVPTNANPGADGRPVTVFHQTDTRNSGHTAGQNWKNSHLEIDGGAMDGFARLEPQSMGYYDRTDIPFYYSLAETFVVCDRWFCSAPAQTYPNRRFLQAATSVGVLSTEIGEILATPNAPNGLIWDRLDAHGIDWADYAYDISDILLFPGFYKTHQGKTRSIGRFLTDAAAGTLPAVSIVSPGDRSFSEENQDIRRGEAYSAMLINAVMNGKAWDKTVMFFMYDEHGGWYDHAAVPAAIPPDDIAPRVKPGDPVVGFDSYGPRVPAVVISPFARKGYVSHVVHDHTSVLRFIETKYNLGALTRRDANASNLLDTLDLKHPAFREPPTLAAPATPTAVSPFLPGAPALPTPA